MKIIAFDIGGTEIKYGIIENELIIIKGSFPTLAHLGGDSVLISIVDKINELRQNDHFDGVAISSAGVINVEDGLVLEATQSIPNYVGLNIKSFIESKVNLLTFVDNDVNCVALAESKFYENFESLFFLTIGTGIGGAIVLNKKIYRGHAFSAGEIGKIMFDHQHFEAVASISSLVQFGILKGLHITNGRDLFELAKNNNLIAKSIVDNFYGQIASGLSTIIYLLNPQIIIIGGGVSAQESLVDNINIKLREKLPNYYYNHVQLVSAKFKNDAGIMGAYFNFIEKIKDA